METEVFCSSQRTKHMGRNMARVREFKGVKQGTLAKLLGVTQAAISKLESEETIPDEKLEEVAKALGVTPDTIKNFDEDKIMYYINNVKNKSCAFINELHGDFKGQFNPIDKLVEVYERLLASEKEKIELIKKLKNQE
jgi:transcriptional regulator with XRE-family HTH domain